MSRDTCAWELISDTLDKPELTLPDEIVKLSYIRQKRIFAVQISGKYIVPKSALAEFLVTDFAFEIVHKSTWHLNTILLFTEKE